MIFHTPLDDDASCDHSQGNIKSKAFINREIGQFALNQEKKHVFNVLNAKPFEIAFLKFVELVIISTYSDPILMLVVMPFDDLKLCDRDDSTFGVDISSRFPIDHKSIELLMFAPLMRDSPESMFVIANRSDEQKNLYKALVDAYECDKLILDTYRDTVTLKRRRDDEDKDEEPFAGSNWGSKKRRAGKEPESTNAPKEKTSKTSVKSTKGSKSHHMTTSESAPAEEPIHITQDLKEPAPQEFETGATDDQPIEEASQHPHLFQKQTKPPTLDRAWHKTLSATYGRIQP
nr:hypothetical protein [Tanacetum cinerariifolium]